MEHMELLINPSKVHIPKYNKKNISLEEFKKNISNDINNYNFNFNKNIDTNEIIDFLMFIQYHNVFKKNLCKDCIKKIDECLK